MLLLLNMSRFWIYHSFKYVRVTQGSKYAWIIPGYVRNLWLNMSEWLLLYIHPLEFLISRNHRLFSWKVNIWFFFYGSSKYLILFFFLDWIVLQVRFQIYYYLLGPKGFESYSTSEISNKYIIDGFLMTYLSICCCCFWHFKEVNQRFTNM